MIPSPFNNSHLNQMAQQALPHQNQPDMPQQGVMSQEQARMWQQMQQIQQSQAQQQQHLPFRPQGGDMGGGQASNQQQIMELLRMRQQQPHLQQVQQQQQFNMQQSMGGPPQMHGQAPHMMQQQGQMPNGLGHLQQALAARNVLQNQQGISRQFDMLLRNQPQNANFAFNQQQQQPQPQQVPQQPQMRQQQLVPAMNAQMQAQGGQGNFYNPSNMPPTPDGMQRFSGQSTQGQPNPQLANMMQQQGLFPQMQQQNAQQVVRNQLSLASLREKYPIVQQQIKDLEKQELLLQNTRAGRSDAEFYKEMMDLRGETNAKRELLKRMHGMIVTLTGASGAPNAQQIQTILQARAASMNQGNPNWAPQPASSPPNPLPNAQLPPNGAHVPPKTPQQMNAQAANQNRPVLPQQLPPRTAQTPLQHAMATAQAPPQGSPRMANMQQNMPHGQPNGMVNGGPNAAAVAQFSMHLQQSGPFPALPSPAFESAFKLWCSKNDIRIDNNLLTMEDGKLISLHRLHQEVIAEGTIAKVGSDLDKWAVIGGRLGYVQFPGTPAKSGPAVAARLQHIYREFLQGFDIMYLKSALSKKMKGEGHNGPQHDMNNGGNIPMAMNASGSQPQPDVSNIPPPSIQGIMALANTQDPQKIQQLLQYSSYPSEVLRARGVPQETIEIVDMHRPLLQRTLMGQTQFHEGVKTSQMNNNLAALQQQQRQNFLNSQAGHAMMQTPGAQGGQQQMPMPGMGEGGRGGQQVPVNGMGNPANAMQQARIPRPSTEEMQRAQQNVQRWYSEARITYGQNPPATRNIQEGQRLEFNQHFGQLLKLVSDVDSKLPMLALLFKEDNVKRLVDIIVHAQIQRHLLSSGNPPHYIMDSAMMRQYIAGIQNSQDALFRKLQAQAQITQAHNAQQQQQQGQPQQMPHNPAMTGVSSVPVPPALLNTNPHMPPPQTQPTQPLQLPPVPTPQPTQPSPRPNATPLMAKKKINAAGDGVASMSTPPASASTPAANAPTPTHVNSPQTPKSPKAKAKPKPAPKRKQSTAKNQQAAPAPAASTPVSVATPSGAEQSSPAAATPDIGSKRRREEDASPAAPTPVDAPSPKKARTDWEGPVNGEVAKRNQEADAVQTDDDAAKFFADMTDLLKMASSDGQEYSAEISDAIDKALQGYSDPTSGDGGFGLLSDVGVSSDASNNLGLGDGLEFFDFTSYNNSASEDDAGSKAATPDLLQASTGPSPESGSESEAAHPPVDDSARIAEPKNDVEEGINLGMGIWKEVDGGQGAYHHPSEGWKWDSPMPALEQPWAILAEPSI